MLAFAARVSPNQAAVGCPVSMMGGSVAIATMDRSFHDRGRRLLRQLGAYWILGEYAAGPDPSSGLSSCVPSAKAPVSRIESQAHPTSTGHTPARIQSSGPVLGRRA